MPYGSYSALQFTTSPTNPVPELTDFVYSDFEVDCEDQVLPDEGYLPGLRACILTSTAAATCTACG